MCHAREREHPEYHDARRLALRRLWQLPGSCRRFVVSHGWIPAFAAMTHAGSAGRDAAVVSRRRLRTEGRTSEIDFVPSVREVPSFFTGGSGLAEATRRDGVALVVGAGDGLGAAVARAFAREGLAVCLTRRPRHLEQLGALAQSIRDAGGRAFAFGLDARLAAAVVALTERIEREIGPLEVVVFNIGANVRFGIVETTTRVYSKVWEMAALAGFLTGREAARVMTPRRCGSILFTGATASVRGGAGYSAFAGAKHVLRALAQSLARELGPQGLHVAHVVIDGMIDGVFARGIAPDAAERLAREEILDPEEIARNYVWLHRQRRSAWTFELDLRPWSEKW